MALTQVSTDGIKNGTITGTDLATNVDLVDNQKIRFGTGNDLQIYHNGSHNILNTSNGNIELKHTVGGVDESLLKAFPNGAVELYHNNSKKFETTNAGINVEGSVTADDIITAGALLHEDDTDTLVHFSAANTIQLKTGGSSRLLVNNFGINLENGYLNSNGNRIILGDSSGATDDRIIFGNNNDLEIYHDGTASFIKNATGGLNLEDTGGYFRVKSDDIKLEAANGEDFLECDANGAVSLYFNASKKFQTTNGGINITGSVACSGGASNNLSLPDNGKAKFGTSDDLQIYHDGSNSKIVEGGTGSLIIQTSNFNLDNAGGTENILTATENGAVELYFDGSKKAETDSFGFEVFGEFRVGSATHSHTHFNYQDGGNNYITQGNSSQTFFRNASGTVRTQIQTDGHWRWKDGIKAEFGDSDDLQIYHEGNHSYIQDAGTGSLILVGNNVTMQKADQSANLFSATENSSVDLYFNGSKKFETTSSGVTVTGTINFGSGMGSGLNSNGFNINFADSDGSQDMAKFGTGGDLRIYHDSANSYIQNITGALRIYNHVLDVRNDTGNETILKGSANGSVELYHNGTHMLSTASDGIQLQGDTKLSRHPNSNSPVLAVTNAQYAKSLFIGGWDGGTNSSGISRVRNSNDNLHIDSGSIGAIYLNAYSSGEIRARHIRPMSDNTFDLGQSNIRWDDVFATNGTIQTSDKTKKNTIVDSDLGLSFINKLKPVSYKFNDGTRTHYGLIAQDIETLLSEINKTTTDFAGFIKTDISDEYYEEAEPNIPDGKKEGDLKSAAHTEYGLRYTEFISPLIKAMQELADKVQVLETEVAALKAS